MRNHNPRRRHVAYGPLPRPALEERVEGDRDPRPGAPIGVDEVLEPAGKEHRIVVPTSQQQHILEEHHDVPTAGHLGVERTLEMLQRIYW